MIFQKFVAYFAVSAWAEAVAWKIFSASSIALKAGFIKLKRMSMG
jgi:hypothetical protein